MATCKDCGYRLPAGTKKYGAKVLSCPRCKAPYIDPQIVELAMVADRSRAKHRINYALQMDQRANAISAVVITVALTMFGSSGIVHNMGMMVVLFTGVFAAINIASFIAKYFLVFPKLVKDSAKRMNNTWYLTRLRACQTT